MGSGKRLATGVDNIHREKGKGTRNKEQGLKTGAGNKN